MFALALYLRDFGQVPLSIWRFSAWIAFSAFFIFSSGCKVSLCRRFRFEGTFSCRSLVCTFSWLLAEFSSSLTARSLSSWMVFSGSICTSWFEVLGTSRYPSSVRVLSDISCAPTAFHWRQISAVGRATRYLGTTAGLQDRKSQRPTVLSYYIRRNFFLTFCSSSSTLSLIFFRPSPAPNRSYFSIDVGVFLQNLSARQTNCPVQDLDFGVFLLESLRLLLWSVFLPGFLGVKEGKTLLT